MPWESIVTHFEELRTAAKRFETIFSNIADLPNHEIIEKAFVQCECALPLWQTFA
jgi:hypothetical protein